MSARSAARRSVAHRAFAPLAALLLATPLAAQRAPVCRAPDYQEGEVREKLVRLATSDEPGPTRMRAAFGLARLSLASVDSIRPVGDAATCRRAAAVYGQSFGPDPFGKGVLVMSFGELWVVARPDGRPGPMVVVLDANIEKRAVWGL